MGVYLMFFTYARDAWRSMVQHPEDREEAAARVIEAAGGELVCFYWMLGRHDGMVIFRVPNATVAAAVSAAVTASGRIERLETIHLLNSREARGSLELAKVIAADHRLPGVGEQRWRTGYDALG